jgi:hypothetical protein
MSSLGGSCRFGKRSLSRLRQPDVVVGVLHDDVRNVGGAVDEGRALGGVTHGALDLLVTGVADEEDLEVLLGEPHGLPVHLGDERARGVDGVEVTVGGTLHDRGRDPVGAEDDVGALGHLVDVVDEDRALLLEGRHDVDVVDDLLAHVDGRAEALEGLLDRDDRPVHPSAVAAGSSEENPLAAGDGGIL